jgi:hypothetical protein
LISIYPRLMSVTDMLGFKLEMPRREDSVSDKVRPIYLDMQASDVLRTSFTFHQYFHRQLHQLTLEYSTPCFPILQTSTATPIVGLTRTAGRLKRPWKKPEKYVCKHCSTLRSSQMSTRMLQTLFAQTQKISSSHLEPLKQTIWP